MQRFSEFINSINTVNFLQTVIGVWKKEREGERKRIVLHIFYSCNKKETIRVQHYSICMCLSVLHTFAWICLYRRIASNRHVVLLSLAMHSLREANVALVTQLLLARISTGGGDERSFQLFSLNPMHIEVVYVVDIRARREIVVRLSYNPRGWIWSCANSSWQKTLRMLCDVTLSKHEFSKAAFWCWEQHLLWIRTIILLREYVIYHEF